MIRREMPRQQTMNAGDGAARRFCEKFHKRGQRWRRGASGARRGASGATRNDTRFFSGYGRVFVGLL